MGLLVPAYEFLRIGRPRHHQHGVPGSTNSHVRRLAFFLELASTKAGFHCSVVSASHATASPNCVLILQIVCDHVNIIQTIEQIFISISFWLRRIVCYSINIKSLGQILKNL